MKVASQIQRIKKVLPNSIIFLSDSVGFDYYADKDGQIFKDGNLDSYSIHEPYEEIRA